MDDVLTPGDAPVPDAISTNSWWDLASQVISTAGGVAKIRAQTGTRAAPAGNIAPSYPSRPLGTTGINPAAAGTPGGQVTFTRLAGDLSATLGDYLPLLIVGVIALVVLRRFG